MGEKAAMSDEKHFSFFQNRQCEYFPCHPGVAETEFNCLFCYCPLYALGKKCGGACQYTEQGIKDCSNCAFPHVRGNYDAVLTRFGQIAEVVKRSDTENR